MLVFVVWWRIEELVKYMLTIHRRNGSVSLNDLRANRTIANISFLVEDTWGYENEKRNAYIKLD